MNLGRNINILVIRDYYPSNNNPSSSTWVYNQVVGLQNLGYKPLVISPTPINPLKRIFKKRFILYDTPSNKIEIYNDTKVIRPGYIKVPANKFIGFTLNQLTRCILKYGNSKTIKLIHAHFGQNGIASIELKKQLNVPLITSFYGYDSGRLAQNFKPYYKKLIKAGDLFLALSQDMKNDLIGIGFPEEKIIIHHLGVNLNEFKYTESHENEKFKLLTVARLDEAKGIQYILKALYLFLNKYPNEKKCISYTILGGGKYEKKLKDLAINLNLEDIVTFKNNLINKSSREIVKEEMMQCNIFCLCSFTSSSGTKEGTPVVLMEAQACGKPCIATYHAGIPEVVINNKTGILVKEKSSEEILLAIEKLFFGKKLEKNLGLNAYMHIKKNFNFETQMQELKLIINKVSKNDIL